MGDPLTPLSAEESEMIQWLQDNQDHDQILADLKENLQTAIEIELATIPIYLFTYYSLIRNQYSGEHIRAIDLYANKAGGMIMSVAVEEMLHLSLSSNILYALGEDPKLYKKSPSPYPTSLPYHNPVGPSGPDGSTQVLIPLSKFSYEQLWHFLQIEYPAAKGAWPEDRNWDTIGQFYSYIRCQICCLEDEDFQYRGADAQKNQIQPYNYSPNNIDTVYPKSKFDPWAVPSASGETSASAVAVYTNQSDSHVGPTALQTITSKREALEAIATICDQGEGYAHQATDDPSKSEDSHYFKFLTLQAQLQQYENRVEQLPTAPTPPDPITPTFTEEDLAPSHDPVVVDFPDNPTTARYAGDSDAQAWSNLCNGVYQYMLILVETIFKVPDPNQKLFFNQAMHYSMIWVLDKLIQAMRDTTISAGPHKDKILAPTFENYDLGERKDAYANLIALTQATDTIETNWGPTIKALPDVSAYWES